MGKGDIRTRRGKLFAGSHGKTRSQNDQQGRSDREEEQEEEALTA